MIKWIKHKIKVHSYKAILMELEKLGVRSRELKEVFFATKWTDRGLSTHARKKLIEEYNKVGTMYVALVDILIQAGLYVELENIHMRVLGTQYMPNDITRSLQEESDWNKY